MPGHVYMNSLLLLQCIMKWRRKMSLLISLGLQQDATFNTHRIFSSAPSVRIT